MDDRGVRMVLLFALLVLSRSHALAIWDKYSPFEPGREPPRFPLTALILVREDYLPNARHVFHFVRPGSKTQALAIDWQDAGDRVVILEPGTPPLFSAPIEGSPVCDAEAAIADLNGDGKPDYVVVTHSGGCGLAAEITYVNFLLSSPNGFAARKVISYDAAPVDLVDLNRDGRPEFVHCMCVWGDKGKDGRSHNYWVYNLLGFSGTQIVSANFASPEFPKWIIYTYGANHKNSTELTAKQRQQQWLNLWAPGEVCFRGESFPDGNLIAGEQGKTSSP